MGISDLDPDAHRRRPWNAGNISGRIGVSVPLLWAEMVRKPLHPASSLLRPHHALASKRAPYPLNRSTQSRIT